MFRLDCCAPRGQDLSDVDRGNHTAFAGEIALAVNGALNWWRDAGVDCAFDDTPTQWLAEPAETPGTAQTPPPPRAPAAAPAPEPIARIGGEPDTWPTDLASFADWWLTEPSLDPGQTEGRIPPRGPATPALMVLVAHPEMEDGADLLSARQGRLLSAILAAMGLTDAETYVASALPRHMPLPDWAALAAGGLGSVVAHHVGLVAPQRLLVFGGNVLPLLGNHLAQSAAVLPTINQEIPNMTLSGAPVLAAPDLAMLLERPKSKARFWQVWLDWSATA